MPMQSGVAAIADWSAVVFCEEKAVPSVLYIRKPRVVSSTL